MCTNVATKAQPVRLPTACRALIQGSTVYLAEPSYEDLAAAHEAYLESDGPRVIEGLTTGAVKTRIDLTLVQGILSEPLAEKLDAIRAEREAAAAAEVAFATPTVDLPHKRFVIEVTGDVATILVEEVGVAAPVEMIERIQVNTDDAASDWDNPAYEGDHNVVAQAVRAICIQEQIHEDKQRAAHPTAQPAE